MASILASRRLSRRLMFGIPFVLAAGGACAQSENDGVKFERSSLVIVTAAREIKFDIDMATTEPQREHGLMFRKQLGAYEGMLFDFFREQPVAFWMKNTLIPLDMVFIADDGTVAAITENAVPHSLVNISSGVPVRATVELQAGITEALDIRVGDKVQQRIFNAGK